MSKCHNPTRIPDVSDFDAIIYEYPRGVGASTLAGDEKHGKDNQTVH
jgi:hypothetical protein